MSLSNFPTGPDGKPSYTALIEALDKVNALANISAEQFGSPITINWNGTGFVVQDNRIPGRWIKITSGSNPYAWTGLVDDTAGDLVTDDDTGAAGTTTIIPAYEVHGKTDVAANTEVWAWPAVDGLSMLFDLSSMVLSPHTWSSPQVVSVPSGSTPPLTLIPPSGVAPLLVQNSTTTPSAPSAGYTSVYTMNGDIHTISTLGTCCYPCIPSSSILDSNVLAHWPMTEQSTGTRSDYGPNGNHFLVYTNPSTPGGTIGYAASPMITGSYCADLTATTNLFISTSQITLGSGSWSIAFWAKMDGTLSANRVFMNVASNTQILYVHASAKFRATRAGVANTEVDSTVTPTSDVNTHFYVQYDHTSGKIGISVNNETLVETTVTTPSTLAADYMTFSSDTAPSSSYAQQIIVKSAVLSTAQRTALYDSGNGLGSPGCGRIPDYYISSSSVTQHTGDISHPSLAGLAWTSSGHTGTATRLFGTSGAGAAAEYTITGTGTVIVAQTSPTLITPAVTTTINPSSNDGAALGTTALGWSDLHLATGAVINWANGEVTITESDANTLTIAGATSFDLGTSCAAKVGTVELGHASDTTLSRLAAGLAGVEGVPVLMAIAATNSSGATSAAGDVGYIDVDGSYKTTTTSGLDALWCVVLVGGANAATIYVARRGVVTVTLDGNCSAGDFLKTSSTAKQATPFTAAQHYAMFAVALTANTGGAGGTCSALLMTGTRHVAASSTNELIRLDAHSTFRFEATINGSPAGGTTVTYNAPSAGAEDTINVTSSSELGKLVLWNTTDGNTSILIGSVNTGTNVITLATGTVPAGWTNTDALTMQSPTMTDTSISRGYEIDLSQSFATIPKTARHIHAYAFKLDTATTRRSFLHPVEAFGNGKLVGPVRTQAVSVANDNLLKVRLISNRFVWISEANGSATSQDAMRLAGYDEACP